MMCHTKIFNLHLGMTLPHLPLQHNVLEAEWQGTSPTNSTAWYQLPIWVDDSKGRTFWLRELAA